MDSFVVSGGKEVFSILKRIKNRDFEGNSGSAIKNSTYQIATTFVSKFGSLLFTIILARLLMPELFGLYSIALFTILLFSFFAEMGLGNTLVKFISESISKGKNSKAKAYFMYIFKLKFLIISGFLILFFVLSKPLAIYYQKPLFMILLSGALYLFSITFGAFLQSFFQALNDFKTPFIRETLFQILRLALVPILVMYLLSKSFSGENILIILFFCFGILWALLSLFLFISAKKTKVFLSKEAKLSLKEKIETNFFIKSLIAFSIFSIIFMYSDLFILGRFVSSEYIGFYQVALGLIGSLSTLVLFSGSLFPIFSRLKGDALEKAFKRSLKITIIISLILFVFSIIISKLLISLLYGEVYSQAIPFFRGLCFLLILWPITALYNGYFMAKGRPEVIKNLLIFVAFLNIGLGLSLAYFLSKINPSLAVFGVIFATILSNMIYITGCLWKKNKTILNKQS